MGLLSSHADKIYFIQYIYLIMSADTLATWIANLILTLK